jgi:hypothetical protein
MRQLQLLIQELNERVYNPVGLNILWPRKVAFLFVSQVELPSEEAVADLIRWKSNTTSVSRFLASCAILISVPVIYHIHMCYRQPTDDPCGGCRCFWRVLWAGIYSHLSISLHGMAMVSHYNFFLYPIRLG